MPRTDPSVFVNRILDFEYSSSPEKRDVIRRARAVSRNSETVVVLGERGIGKSTLARAIHTLSSREGLFIPQNCATLKEETAESLLFGHAKGSYTGAHQTTKGLFETADGGTLFLDEIDTLPISVQQKLLTYLSEGAFYRLGDSPKNTLSPDVRLLVATNKDFDSLVDERKLLPDLKSRLDVLRIKIPPLRDWPAMEMIELCGFLIETKFSGKSEETPPVLSAKSEDLILAHTWPDNVRELENALTRGICFGNGKTIEPEDMEITFQKKGEKPFDVAEMRAQALQIFIHEGVKLVGDHQFAQMNGNKRENTFASIMMSRILAIAGSPKGAAEIIGGNDLNALEKEFNRIHQGLTEKHTRVPVYAPPRKRTGPMTHFPSPVVQ